MAGELAMFTIAVIVGLGLIMPPIVVVVRVRKVSLLQPKPILFLLLWIQQQRPLLIPTIIIYRIPIYYSNARIVVPVIYEQDNVNVKLGLPVTLVNKVSSVFVSSSRPLFTLSIFRVREGLFRPT